jgi:hypothetical protein
MDAEPDLKPSGGAPGGAEHLALRIDRRLHRIQRPFEDR